MAGVRFTELQSRPLEFLDFTSVPLDEFQWLCRRCRALARTMAGELVATNRRRKATDIRGELTGDQMERVGDNIVARRCRPSGYSDVARSRQRRPDRRVLLGMHPLVLQEAEPLVWAQRTARHELIDEPRRGAVEGDDDNLGRRGCNRRQQDAGA